MKTGRVIALTPAGTVQKKLFTVLLALVVVTMLLQLVVLATVGTMGPEVSRLRSKTDELRLNNELIQAEIRKEQTSSAITTFVNEKFAMAKVNAELLELNTDSTLAQSPE